MSETTTPAATEQLAEDLRQAIRGELDEVVPHLVAALKRDRAFDALTERLAQAEQRLEARRERPMAVAVLRALHQLRHLDFEPTVKRTLDHELTTVLNAAGFQETGAAGEPFDPARHQPLSGASQGGDGVVAEVYASGLTCFDDVILRAQVRVDTPDHSEQKG
jgi:molecular chaperone GrpE (heat shock protein)